MALKLGDEMPDFAFETNEGSHPSFHAWISKDSPEYVILFSHPADYTPVCTTELARVAQLMPEFRRRNVKCIALSCDSAEHHRGWIEGSFPSRNIHAQDVRAYAGVDDIGFPIIADEARQLAYALGMLDADERTAEGLPLTCRAVFIIGGNDRRVKLSLLYPATTGRNFDEILRAIDSLHLTATKKVATPVDWKMGSSCMVVPSVKDVDLATLFPAGVDVKSVPSGKTYLRITPQP